MRWMKEWLPRSFFVEKGLMLRDLAAHYYALYWKEYELSDGVMD